MYKIILALSALGFVAVRSANILKREKYSVAQETEEDDGAFFQLSVDQKEYFVNISTQGVSKSNPLKFTYGDSRVMGSRTLELLRDVQNHQFLMKFGVVGGMFFVGMSSKVRNIEVTLTVWYASPTTPAPPTTIPVTSMMTELTTGLIDPTTTEKEKKRVVDLMMITGITAGGGVILFVIMLCVCVKLRNKYRKKQEKDEETGKDPEQAYPMNVIEGEGDSE